MKKLILLLASVLMTNLAHAQLYVGKETTVHFLSKASLEDIEAKNRVSKPVLDRASGAFQVQIANKQFKFASALMEEHFNENYMETEKYPNSTFKGKITEKIDYAKDGQYPATCTGTLDMHGIQQPVTITGTITVSGKQITVVGKFKVKLVDYKIKVPSLYVKNIAEELDVDMTSVMEPYVKK